ncbi:MAG: hypothetical protein RJQ14_04565 [Marinoscillum sp.]
MKYISFLALVLFVASCSSPKKAETEEKPDIKTEVLDIHDEVMPKMGELRATQKKLLVLADSSVADSIMASKYRALANDIKLANEGMMDWMRNYDPEYEGTEEEVALYLQDQLKSVKKVRDDMNSSLQEGKNALEGN